jgi:hypothetical protein
MGDESRRLVKIGDNWGIHLSNDFYKRGTRINKFWYDDSGTVPWDEKHELLLYERGDIQGKKEMDCLLSNGNIH